MWSRKKENIGSNLQVKGDCTRLDPWGGKIPLVWDMATYSNIPA